MNTRVFQRARKPEQRIIRREAILAAAAALFDEQGAQGAGLNAIAARAGFTKSNVYRYFESREEVLLSLFLSEMERLVTEFEAQIAAIASGDVDALAAVVTNSFVSRPRLAALTAILSTTLEQNVSEATVIGLKRAMGGQLRRLAEALHRGLPQATLDDCSWAVGIVGVMVAGIWPGAHPAAAAARVLARPEFAHLKPDIDRDLGRAVRAVLASLG